MKDLFIDWIVPVALILAILIVAVLGCLEIYRQVKELIKEKSKPS